MSIIVRYTEPNDESSREFLARAMVDGDDGFHTKPAIAPLDIVHREGSRYLRIGDYLFTSSQLSNVASHLTTGGFNRLEEVRDGTLYVWDTKERDFVVADDEP